jgi:hypothetical protein
MYYYVHEKLQILNLLVNNLSLNAKSLSLITNIYYDKNKSCPKFVFPDTLVSFKKTSRLYS